MKKITFQLKSLLLFLFLTTLMSYAQQAEKCLTDKLAATERKKNPVLFDKNRAELELFTRQYAQKQKNIASKSVATITKIPTIIHVIHNGEAVGTYPNISDVQLISAITNLNDAFKNTGIYANTTFLGNSSYNSPMDIEFVLAKVKEDGTATTGIERHNVTGKSYALEYNTNGILGKTVAQGGSGVDSETLFKDYFWNPQDYMNIWIVNKIDGVDIGVNGNGTLGYATLPTTNPGLTDGLVCQARAFGYYPSYVPPATQPAGPIDYDFGYGSDCANASRNGTADHEVGHYLNLQHTFQGDSDDDPVGSVCPPLSGTIGTDDDGCPDIAPHKRTNSICPAESATINTCVSPSGPNEYIHNFMNYSNDPCFTGFSNDQRTRVHAAIDGPRGAFKTAIGHLTPSIASFPAAIANTPQYTGVNNAHMGIFEVTLGGNTFKSLSTHNDGFYLNRVASQPTTTLVANTTYPMTVKVGVGGNNNELVDVYIDYNNDGDFAVSERVHQTPGGGGKKNGDVFTINFTTPTVGNFIDGQKLRMRVISSFDNGVNALSSSYKTNYGNIEDYSVVFNPIVLSVASNQIKASEINIYPNPTNDILNISNKTNNELIAISIFDTLGRQVLKVTSTDKIAVDHLNNGVYLLKLEFTNNSIVTKRFIKK